jgi:hypothetical protein
MAGCRVWSWSLRRVDMALGSCIFTTADAIIVNVSLSISYLAFGNVNILSIN